MRLNKYSKQELHIYIYEYKLKFWIVKPFRNGVEWAANIRTYRRQLFT